MNLIIIIKRDRFYNQTLSSIKFDQYGSMINVPYVTCDNWPQGFRQAKSLEFEYGLFVNSGTVFLNFNKFMSDLENYPHQGLIGHIIDPLKEDKFYYLDQQCFILELNKFTATDLDVTEFESVPVERSEINLHDNYTPLWIKSTNLPSIPWTSSHFGEGLLAKQLKFGPAVNFNNTLRASKQFLYNNKDVNDWTEQQNEYIKLAESQLWIFNNEPIPMADLQILIAPASGMCWIKNLVNDIVRELVLVDISLSQLKLAETLWADWNGNNYGAFVHDFMLKNSIVHFNLDQPIMSKFDRLKLKNPKFFIEQVNKVFDEQVNDTNFAYKWQQAKKSKNIKFYNQDLVKFLPEYLTKNTHEFNLWSSNILDYKYTLIKNFETDIDQFNQALKNPKVRLING